MVTDLIAHLAGGKILKNDAAVFYWGRIHAELCCSIDCAVQHAEENMQPYIEGDAAMKVVGMPARWATPGEVCGDATRWLRNTRSFFGSKVVHGNLLGRLCECCGERTTFTQCAKCDHPWLCTTCNSCVYCLYKDSLGWH